MDKIAMFFLGQISCAVVCVLMSIALRIIYTGVTKWKMIAKEENENDSTI
jgi:hypothetical protein